MTLGRLAAILAVSSLTACAAAPARLCLAGEQSSIADTLYFGTGKPSGVVTDEEWNRFLELTVTPRFPRGLTVSDASGQWRGANGEVVHESSHVLHLVHPDDARDDALVGEIISAYKKQFEQEAVLRVRLDACSSL